MSSRGVVRNGARKQKITVPTAITQWQDAILPIRPREFVERSMANIVQWTVMPSGGHFPFYEERERYVADVLEFGRKLRQQESARHTSN